MALMDRAWEDVIEEAKYTTKDGHVGVGWRAKGLRKRHMSSPGGRKERIPALAEHGGC